jgi:hypothetical protein
MGYILPEKVFAPKNENYDESRRLDGCYMNTSAEFRQQIKLKRQTLLFGTSQKPSIRSVPKLNS